MERSQSPSLVRHAAERSDKEFRCEPSERPSLPANSRPDECPGPSAAGDGGADDRPSGAVFHALAWRSSPAWPVFPTDGPVVVYPGSGTGGWEAALVNTLCPATRVSVRDRPFRDAVAADGRQARTGGRLRARRLAARGGPGAVEEKLAADPARDQSSGAWCTTRPPPGSPARSATFVRRWTRVGHPALFLVDTISSLGSIDYRHDEWGVDVTVGGSQKGLMLPPGLGFNAISDKALGVESGGMPRSYWDWSRCWGQSDRVFPLHAGDQPALWAARGTEMLLEEGLSKVFARHERHAAATRAAVRAWGLEVVCLDGGGHSEFADGGAGVRWA